jgi:hypothetical protein
MRLHARERMLEAHKEIVENQRKIQDSTSFLMTEQLHRRQKILKDIHDLNKAVWERMEAEFTRRHTPIKATGR